MSLQEAALARQARGLLGLVETGVEGSVSGSGGGLVDSDAAEPFAFPFHPLPTSRQLQRGTTTRQSTRQSASRVATPVLVTIDDNDASFLLQFVPI
jgi:hypothetical protein